jgi:hypothetical protein
MYAVVITIDSALLQLQKTILLFIYRIILKVNSCTQVIFWGITGWCVKSVGPRRLEWWQSDCVPRNSDVHYVTRVSQACFLYKEISKQLLMILISIYNFSPPPFHIIGNCFILILNHE